MRYVEGLNDASRRPASFFQHPVDQLTDDQEDYDAQRHTVVGEQAQAMALHKGQKAAMTAQATTNDTTRPIPSAT